MLSKPAVTLVIVVTVIITMAVGPAMSSQSDVFDGYRGADADYMNRSYFFEQESRDYNSVPGRENRFKTGEHPDKENANFTNRVTIGKEYLPDEVDGDHGHNVVINKSWGFKWLVAPDCLDDASGLRFYQDHPPRQSGHKQNLAGEDEDLLQAAATAPGPGYVNYSYGMQTFVDRYGARLSTNPSDEFLYHDKVDWPSPEYARNNADSKSFNFSNNDAFVARLTECVQITENPGWKREAIYDEYIYPNGSSVYSWGHDGRHKEKSIRDLGPVEGTLSYSNWVYICECDSYDEAVEKLGPPPVGEHTCDYKADAKYCGSETNESEGATGVTTPTATETQTPELTGTPLSTSTEPAAGTQTARATASQTATKTDTQDVATDEQDDGGTDTGQPGFGVVATIMAIVGATLLYRRQ